MLERMSDATKAKADEVVQLRRAAGATEAQGREIISQIVSLCSQYQNLPQASAEQQAAIANAESELFRMIRVDLDAIAAQPA